MRNNKKHTPAEINFLEGTLRLLNNEDSKRGKSFNLSKKKTSLRNIEALNQNWTYNSKLLLFQTKFI